MSLPISLIKQRQRAAEISFGIANEHLAKEEFKVASLKSKIAKMQQELDIAEKKRDLLLQETARAHVEYSAMAEQIKGLEVPAPKILEGRIDWKKTTITVIGDGDTIADVAEKVDNGVLQSDVASIRAAGSWHTKHHPTAKVPASILDALLDAGEEGLHFTKLVEITGLPSQGDNRAQNYLRELYKMGLIGYTY